MSLRSAKAAPASSRSAALWPGGFRSPSFSTRSRPLWCRNAPARGTISRRKTRFDFLPASRPFRSASAAAARHERRRRIHWRSESRRGLDHATWLWALPYHSRRRARKRRGRAAARKRRAPKISAGILPIRRATWRLDEGAADRRSGQRHARYGVERSLGARFRRLSLHAALICVVRGARDDAESHALPTNSQKTIPSASIALRSFHAFGRWPCGDRFVRLRQRAQLTSAPAIVRTRPQAADLRESAKSSAAPGLRRAAG